MICITFRSIAFICAISLFFLNACTPSKRIVYFQDVPAGKTDTLKLTVDHRIRANDILHITVSSLSAEMDNIVNAVNASGAAVNAIPGYLVSQQGQIEMPFAGIVNVAGLTPVAAKDTVRSLLSPYLKDPRVNLRVANFKISLLGEVNRPGTYNIPSEKVSILEALSLAGDLTIAARRDNVLIIREQDGIRVYERLDLRNSELFKSPYYYLQSNDVIYIEPGRGKIAQNDTRTWQVLTFVATTLSLATIILTRAKL